MLVNSRRSPRVLHRDESGATLVVVLVIMLVLSIAALTLAAVVTNTTAGLVGSRDTVQSRAAADAGLATAVADARRTGSACGVNLTSTTAPKYTVTSVCSSDRVTFTATGWGASGGSTRTEAVYENGIPDPGAGADMVFFGNTTFSNQVLTYPLDEDLLSIVIPTGDFTCMATVPANIVVGGDFTSKGGCDVEGTVVAGGEADMANSSDTVRGGLSAAATTTAKINGRVHGSLTTGGGINFSGAGSYTYPGNVQAGGSVNMGSVSIAGSLTMPTSGELKLDGWIVVPPAQTTHSRITGGIVRPATVTAPPEPTFEEWFDYALTPGDWPGYTTKTLINSGAGAGTCRYYNEHPATGWAALAALTSPTIIDARACSNLSANSGTNPVVSVQTDIVFLANSYDLTYLTFNPAAGKAPHVWWVVEDTNDNGTPSCSGGAGDIKINHTVMSPGITSMAYTPCEVNVRGNSKWTGSFYGGSFNYGGGMTFFGDPITLPRQPSSPVEEGGGGASGLGALLSQRDVP